MRLKKELFMIFVLFIILYLTKTFMIATGYLCFLFQFICGFSILT